MDGAMLLKEFHAETKRAAAEPSRVAVPDQGPPIVPAGFFLKYENRKNWESRGRAVLGVAASRCSSCLMLITFVDVVSRYLFNLPLRGGFEATELMLLVLIFAGLPLVSHADEHVDDGFHRPHAAGGRLPALVRGCACALTPR